MKKRVSKFPLSVWMSCVRKMLKDSAIRNELDSRWFSVKACNNGLSIEQIEELNKAIWDIASSLASVRIIYRKDRESVAKQIRYKTSQINPKYLYDDCLSHDKQWWEDRVSENGIFVFTPEDVVMINLGIADVAKQLLFFELIPEREDI